MTSIKIFQNFITDADKSGLDPAFAPYDWRHNPHPELREIAIFFDMFDKGRYREATYTGLFSKRFGEKTGAAGSQLIRFIEKNPGYDVYFMNPYHYFKMYSYNIWDHGELWHPGIIDLTQKLFIKANIDITIDRYERENEKNFALL